MTTPTIVNGAPMTINLGTQDLSTTQVPVAAEATPQHLPLFFIFAQRGNGDKYLCDGTSREQIFGTDTFMEGSPYFNHATLFANEANSVANSCMIQRVIPTDAGPAANAILWLDVLQTQVDLYQRNADGSIFVDQYGDPTITGTTSGLKVKWVQTYRTTLADQENFGTSTQVGGDQTDGVNTSTRYPIFELQNQWQGADGNNTGFRLWAPTATGGNVMPTQMMTQYNAYPYYFSVIERTDPLSSPTLDKTITGETQVLFTFETGVINPTTNQNIGYDQIILNSYNQINVPGYPNIYGRLGKMFVYENNITTLLTLMYSFESQYITTSSDITTNPATAGLLNFVTGVSSLNIPYQTYVFVDSPTSVRMSQYSNVFFKGGSDGTMDNDMFESLVQQQLARYADTADEVQDLAYNTESVFYDSGYTLDTKYAIAQFISVRKDTVVIMGTHTVGQPVLTEAEEQSVAISVRTRLQMFPESDYFGTPVMRAMIMGRSGQVRDSTFTDFVPGTFEIINKFGQYMGAGNGAWKSGFSPEGAPGSIVTRLMNINITWVSDNVRNQDWDMGLNWILRFDRTNFFIPAYKTIYDNDTSVLNSTITAFAIGQINKIANACWRTFSGRSDLTPAQLTDRCNTFIGNGVANIFDNRFVIIPAATLTDMDSLRGFSWSLPVKIGADNMRTVMTTWVEAFRQSDLTSTS